ncbi:hypothetical protein QBC37DRAFT_29427 [Rhypophila decipiens]|uniref:Uncharacterized protein n=1 Tax=Rhypophila decipiens TaxID=261697 RepID=A0AAN6Y143_9PEZI|nr:hypothetical protein QBC37DRAFT_29427 [Rhypophila decipiens]
MRFTTLNLALLATTAMAASIPREEQPQIVLADHQQPQPTSSPSSPEEERTHGAGMTMLTTTVTKTKTATIAMTTATVIRTETATPTAQPSSSSSPHWSWTSLSNWLFGSSRAGHCAGGNSATGLSGLGGIKPNLLAEGMGCFCSAGSVCCYNSNAQVMCNYGTCGVI